MIYSLNGILKQNSTNFIVIECGGVGYGCAVSLVTASKMPAIDSPVSVFTHLNVREDAMELFAFFDTVEQSCFRLLISVSGVGPKAALSILSELSPESFALAVISSDVKALTRASGVGAKLAQRVILELKDKISKQSVDFASGEVFAGSSAPVITGGSAGEAMAALVALGYSQSQAAKAISSLDPALPVEEMIKLSLRALAMGN